MTTELMNLHQNLQQNFTLQLKNSLGYIYPVYTCGGTGGWRRVVYLDMTDPNTNCPSGWQLTSHSKRTCGRVSTGQIMLVVLVLHMAVHENTSGHLQLVRLRLYLLILMSVLVMLPLILTSHHLVRLRVALVQQMMFVLAMLLLILPSHHLWVETISVNQDGRQARPPELSILMILSGMVKTVYPEVHAAHSTILHISLNNSPALPLMI